MMKKTTIKSKHFVCFIIKTSKKLKVKIQYKTKNCGKIAKINNEAAKKKKIQQLSYIKDRVKKADICSIMASLYSLGFFRFGRDMNNEFMFEV